MRKVLAALVAVFLLPLPALGHSVEELRAWEESWFIRVEALGYTETAALSHEWRAMVADHLWYFDPAPVEVRRASQPIELSTSAGAPPSYSVEQWRPLVTAYWPAELVEWALRIIACESGGNPYAENPRSTAAGLFQFLRSTWDRGPAPALGLGSYDSGAVFDPETNIRAGAWLYANWGGTSQWSCKR
jgi:soluble lytic murein transglycosylase-like protein